MHAYMFMYGYMFTYMHTYDAGMSIHPFPMEFLCFGGKNLHCLIFDDVITLHH